MIIIKRESAYADKLRKYKIVLDGKVIGELADGQSKSFDAKSGEHTLRMKIDWARSNEVKFQSTENETIHFRTSNRMRGVKMLLAIIYATILRNRYLELERID